MKPVSCVCVCVCIHTKMETPQRSVLFNCKLFYDTVSHFDFTASYDWMVVTN